MKNSNCEVKLICDFDSDKLHNFSKKYPFLNTTTNPEDVLNDAEINLISVASYDNYHCEQILKALENNKNVFVEKPLCQDESELKKIINALRKNPHLNLSSNLLENSKS